MKIIIEYLDNYLTQIGRPNIDAVEANSILAKACILRDSKDRPGKPLRDLLRKGKLPHAFQSGGKGSTWIIPHSSKQTSKIIATKLVETSIKKPKQIIKVSEDNIVDILQIEKVLMNEKNFKIASTIDNLVPLKSGLYCIRISNINKLPKPYNIFLADRQHDIIYIGIATESLKSRFLNQELRANGHGTFFRSIGTLLGYRPPKGSLVTKKNIRNYKFASTDEQKIIKWINNNLKVNWIEFSGDFENLETVLISKHKPLLNIAKNPLALNELSDLRKTCVKIANDQ